MKVPTYHEFRNDIIEQLAAMKSRGEIPTKAWETLTSDRYLKMVYKDHCDYLQAPKFKHFIQPNIFSLANSN